MHPNSITIPVALLDSFHLRAAVSLRYAFLMDKCRVLHPPVSF